MKHKLTFTGDNGVEYALRYVDEGPESENVRVCSPDNPEGVLIPYAVLKSLLTIYRLDVHHDWMEHRAVRSEAPE